MTPEEKASYGDSVARFNVKKQKVAEFCLEKVVVHVLENNTKFHLIFLWFQASLFCHHVVSNDTRFSKSGGAFHHLVIALLNISMPGDHTLHIFPS